MKHFLFPILIIGALVVAFSGTTPDAVASLFSTRHAASGASPTPSPTTAPLPTATPEPANIAIPRLQAEIKANPNDQDAMTQLASEYLSINQPNLSLPLTQHLLAMGDKNAQVYFLDGYGQQADGQIGNAIADLEQASTLDPTNVAVLANLADLYLTVNQPADAERVANRAVTFNKTNPDAYMALGGVYSAESHYDDARIQFEQAFSLDKTDTKPLFAIVQSYISQNNIPMALQTVDRALVVDPNSVEGLVMKADLYGRQHDDVHASEAYDDAAVAAPTDEQKVAIEVRKAQYFVGEHKDAQAAAVFQELITKYPNIGLSYIGYGSYLAVTLHEVDEAVVQFRKGLAIDPDNEDGLRDMGEYELQHSDPSDAVTYLKHLADVAPSAEGYELLGAAYNRLHEYALQKDACSKSFVAQRSPETLGCIAGADYELHNYREASRIFDVLDSAARGFLDQNPQLLFVAAKTYAGNHERDKAIGAYERLLSMMPRGSKEYKSIQQALTHLDTSH